MQDSLDILFGSRTGNSRSIARLASGYANKLGLKTNLFEMNRFDFNQIYKSKYLLIIVSTHGEGDPPAPALEFYNYMHEANRLDLSELKFCVLALGDSSYKDYCKTGKDFNRRLIQLSAESLLPVQECDVDFEDAAIAWIKTVVEKNYQLISGIKEVPVNNFSFNFYDDEMHENGVFQTSISDLQNLCSDESTKQTLHLALSFDDKSKEYSPGDSLAIHCPNSRLLVDKILKKLRLDGTHAISKNGKAELLKNVLINKYELSLLTPVVLGKYANLANNHELNGLVENPEKVNSYCFNHDVLDMVSDFPSKVEPEEFLQVLRKLKPRLYSIANSSKVFPGEIHVTLGVMRYQLNNRAHTGVTSSFLSERIGVGERMLVHVENNDSFRLPANENAPVIMIGCGTGIAPYRAFLQERKAIKASGKNWLIFGERNSKTDFLYKEELHHYQKNGVLNKLDTAFSRDRKSKYYVQDIIQESSSEVIDWIYYQKAFVYICGNKRTMAISVRNALKEVLRKEMNWSMEKTENYIKMMKTESRWQEDVY